MHIIEPTPHYIIYDINKYSCEFKCMQHWTYELF